jgi:hypothetical protein
MLAVWTGQRQGDLLVLPWSAYDGQFIRLRQRKGKKGKGRRVKIPVGAPLKVMLDRTPRVATVILTTTNETAGRKADSDQAGAKRARRLSYRTGSLSTTCAAPP